jgi:hypothetical protein
MDPDYAKFQILADFPTPVLADLTMIVGRAYPRAAANANDRFTREVAHDYYPSERRAIIENSLPLLRYKHPGTSVVPRSNKRGTSYFQQISRNRSILTVSKTLNPGDLPRDADFRQTLARDPQLVLETFADQFPEFAPNPEADAYYGIVTHGSDDNDPAKLGYIEILIPDSTGKHVLGRIDLIPLWNAGEARSFEVEEIAPVEPRLRVVPRPAAQEPGA